LSDDVPDHQRSLTKQRALLGVARLIINALSLGLVFTIVLAVLVLWLEKRSGIALEREQYRGLLAIIFLTITLSAYLVLEYFQQRRNEREAKAKGAQKRKPREEPAYAPIFAEPEPAATSAPVAVAPAPETNAGDYGLALEEPAANASFTPAKPVPLSAVAGLPATVPAVKDPTASVFVQSVSASVAGLDEEPTLFAHFGLRLYVMGGCGELTRRNALTTAQGKSLLIHMLTDMGVTKRDAISFAANANTFAQVPNFRGPIDAGYSAMAHLHEAGFLNIAELIDVLAHWKIQDGICQPPEPVTFMATAIGVAMPGAATPPEDRQRSLRAHNTFVGAALDHFQGREIHNLGNGIIAAFTDTTLAVRAAENILEQLDVFARENPKLTVLPHIGIDTEMAVLVNGTYVSAALTRAVTIAALTPTNHIYCSEATCGDAAEVFSFEPVTAIESYTELPPVFSASWSRAPAKGGPAVEYRQIGTLADAS
jgi:hypothetical protein